MTIDVRRLALLALLPALAGCETIYEPQASRFGDANRMTMAAAEVDLQSDRTFIPTVAT